jgi:curved DNA-binding protein
MEDYYKILGVSKKSSQDEIKKAYRKLAMKWHPDKNKDQQEIAEKKFKKISEAYQILGDENNRKSYDIGGNNIDFTKMNFVNPQDLFNNDEVIKKMFNHINKTSSFNNIFNNLNFSQTSFFTSSSSSQTFVNNGNKMIETITTTQNGITKQIIKENGNIISEKIINNNNSYIT